MSDLDLLNKSMANLYVELKLLSENCEDSNRSFYLGRVSGIELAMSLLEAWKREVTYPEEILKSLEYGLVNEEVKTSQ